MKKILAIVLILTSVSYVGYSFAHEEKQRQSSQSTNQTQKTARFDIKNMTCASCDITVRKAMTAIDGVVSADVDFESASAVVVYDPAKTTTKAICLASTNAGYEATLVKE